MIILWELLQQGGEGPRNSFFQDRKTHSSFLGIHFSYRAQKTMRAALQVQFCVSTGCWGDKRPSTLAQKKSIFLLNTDHEEKKCNRDIELGPVSHPLHRERCSHHPNWASLCPCHGCSSNRCLVAPGPVGIGEPSPAPRTNILHLTASGVWSSLMKCTRTFPVWVTIPGVTAGQGDCLLWQMSHLHSLLFQGQLFFKLRA